MPVQCKHQPVLSAVHHIEKDIERHGKLKANTEDEVLAALGQSTHHDITETFQLVYAVFKRQH